MLETDGLKKPEVLETDGLKKPEVLETDGLKKPEVLETDGLKNLSPSVSSTSGLSPSVSSTSGEASLRPSLDKVKLRLQGRLELGRSEASITGKTGKQHRQTGPRGGGR